MLAYLTKSFLQALMVMLAVAFIGFSMFRFVGDPVANLMGQEATIQDREELARQLGLEDPIPVQFLNFVRNAARGEFGVSYRQGRPVSALLAERLPATLELALLSAAFALVVGLAFGVYAAIRPNGVLANLMMSVSLIGVSLPTFLIGIGLIYVFAVECRTWSQALAATTGWQGWSGFCLPSFGRGDTVRVGWWTTGLLTESGLKSLVMPVITLGFFQLTLVMRLVRSEMLEVMRTDFVKFARARGLPERVVQLKHALRNTMIPVVTIVGLQLGSVVAFAIVTETVFQWPGLGALFVQSVQFVDIPVMSAYLMFVGFVFVVVNLSTDFLYLLLDPRLRTARAAAAR
jgi:peptide/nickel transport system permease protein